MGEVDGAVCWNLFRPSESRFVDRISVLGTDKHAIALGKNKKIYACMYIDIEKHIGLQITMRNKPWEEIII